MPFTVSEQIRAFYEKYDEANRLATSVFQLEFARTQEILQRHYEKTLAIEGPGGWLQNFDAWWNDAAWRERLLNLIRRVESEPSLLGASAHIMGIARKS